MRYLELFAGAGGMSMGLEEAGMAPVAHEAMGCVASIAGWTATGTREDGSTYQLSDSARYRLCGNGVGAPVAAWIGRQLMECHAAL